MSLITESPGTATIDQNSMGLIKENYRTDFFLSSTMESEGQELVSLGRNIPGKTKQHLR